jgi:hypothetical protein
MLTAVTSTQFRIDVESTTRSVKSVTDSHTTEIGQDT